MEEKQLVSEYSETLDLRQSLFNIGCRTPPSDLLSPASHFPVPFGEAVPKFHRFAAAGGSSEEKIGPAILTNRGVARVVVASREGALLA